nr:sigma-70 family RNA polymerase sigma factor [Candidatus Cyanaurora vandensis]
MASLLRYDDPTAPVFLKGLTMPVTPDREVFRSLQAGDLTALSVLYDRYGGLVHRLALRVLGNVSEAEDLTQEIFLMLWKNQGYDPNRGSLSNYLLTLTRSRAIDRLRSRSSNLRFLQKWSQNVPTPPTTPFEHAALGERSTQVRAALQELPLNQRQVLELAYYDGLTQMQIADTLNTPLGTVKTRARQGLLKLRQLLQDFVG